MTEKEMRESKVPWPKNIWQLYKYIRSLLKIKHDYGTCVYAMSMSATATFYYVAHKLGVSGFQASCADMDILRRTRHYEHGFMIIDYKNLLYPQYWTPEHFPTPQYLFEKNKDHLLQEVDNLLENNNSACKEVRDHWELLKRRHSDD
jgi:hypothetical protein